MRNRPIRGLFLNHPTRQTAGTTTVAATNSRHRRSGLLIWVLEEELRGGTFRFADFRHCHRIKQSAVGHHHRYLLGIPNVFGRIMSAFNNDQVGELAFFQRPRVGVHSELVAGFVRNRTNAQATL